jgi:prolipoprotein diacylglyceryltransferase
MLTHIPIGPAVIPAYPFLTLVGLWAGMWLAAREGERLGLDGDHFYNIGLYGFLAGLLGGRGWYVLTHWESYADAPLQALALTANAISTPAAYLCALGVSLFYIRRYQLSLPLIADTAAFGAALGLVIGGIGAFLGSQTLGTPTTLPWGVSIFGQTRHPAHLYLVTVVLLIMAVLWSIKHRPRWPGFIFLLFVELYAASRLLLDPFFATQQTISGGFRTVQVLALLTMVIALAAMMQVDQRRLVDQPAPLER